MKLEAYEHKRVKIVDIDEQVFIGNVIDYLSAEDNEPEGEAIIIKNLSGELTGSLLEFHTEEIKEITVIE